jgi:dsRNA-specific ribonuclease
MESVQQLQGIFLGNRGESFKCFISTLLKKGSVTTKYIKMLTDIDAMRIYGSAFTSEVVDPHNNYQVLEQVGDLAANKFINNYMYSRFPQLDCTSGVAVVARLRIKYGAKNSFAEIARKLGFWEFISATNDLRQRKMKPLLEDVLEAFIGATERIIDNRKRIGVGYAIVYDILASIFDEMEISLKYEDLYDGKTRIKELFDMHEGVLGPLVYKDQKRDLVQQSTVFRVKGGKYEEKTESNGNITVNKNKIIGGQYIKIGEGTASLKADAQQNAALDALSTLEKQGWSKPVPLIYQIFNKGKDVKADVYDCDAVQKRWGSDINILQYTKEKTKYQIKYQSTPLLFYCMLRSNTGVESCMNMGANPNIADTEGMFAVDLLLIGKVDEKLLEDILKVMTKKTIPSGAEPILKVHKSVFNMYFPQYVGDYFKTMVDKFVLVE